MAKDEGRKTRWTADQMPDLSGKTVLVTGANSGLGYEASLAFARKGARVVLACRDSKKGHAAAEGIATAAPGVQLEVMTLDLASLASVESFAERFCAGNRQLHILCNNAGVMALPHRKTADGFEMQFGTNHLGHFALTGRLLEPLLAADAARVVTVSSNAHRFGTMHFDDVQGERRYGKWRAYGQSKLANLLFTLELQRKLEAAGKTVLAVAAHPGYAATNLQAAGPRMEGARLMESLTDLSNRLLAQSAAMGALPILYAATAGEVRGGDYIGPDGLAENWGYPKKSQPSRRARDAQAAARLWELSEALTGVRYDALKR